MCGADQLLRIKRKGKEDFQDEDQRERHSSGGIGSVDRQEREDNRHENKRQQQKPNPDFPNVTTVDCHEESHL